EAYRALGATPRSRAALCVQPGPARSSAPSSRIRLPSGDQWGLAAATPNSTILGAPMRSRRQPTSDSASQTPAAGAKKSIGCGVSGEGVALRTVVVVSSRGSDLVNWKENIAGTRLAYDESSREAEKGEAEKAESPKTG